MNLIQSRFSKIQASFCKKNLSVVLLLYIFITIISGCISVRFESHTGTENNVEVKFETPIVSQPATNGPASAQPLTATLEDTPQPTFHPPYQTPQFMGRIIVHSYSNVGITYTAPQSGTYIFQYHEPISPFTSGNGQWGTQILAFQGTVPQWGNEITLNYDTALLKMGRLGFATKQAAVDFSTGERGIVELRAAEVITFVVADGKPWYGDNTGDIILDVYALNKPLPSTAIKSEFTPADSGRLIFDNNFDDGSANGIAINSLAINNTKWEIIDDNNAGKLLQMSNKSSRDWISFSLGSSSISNGRIEYKVKFLNISPLTGEVACNFRSNPQSRYLVALQADMDSASINYQGPNDQWSLLGNASQLYDFENNTWYNFRVDFIGNEITVYINGKKLLATEDNSLQTGDIYLSISPNTVVQFDDIRIWSRP